MGHRRRCSCCCGYFLDPFEREEINEGDFAGLWTGGDDWKIEERDGSRRLVAKAEGASITCEKEHPGGSTNVVASFMCLLPIDCTIKVSIGPAAAEFVQSDEYGQNGRVRLYDGETLLKDEAWDTRQTSKPVEVRICVAEGKIFAGGSWAEVTQPETSKVTVAATAIAEEATVYIDNFTLAWHSSDRDGCPSCSTYPKPECGYVEGTPPICVTVTFQQSIDPTASPAYRDWCNCQKTARLRGGGCRWDGFYAGPSDRVFGVTSFVFSVSLTLEGYATYNNEGLPENGYKLTLICDNYAVYVKDFGTKKPRVSDLYATLDLVSEPAQYYACSWPSSVAVQPSDLIGEDCTNEFTPSIYPDFCPCNGIAGLLVNVSGLGDVPVEQCRYPSDGVYGVIPKQSQCNGSYFIKTVDFWPYLIPNTLSDLERWFWHHDWWNPPSPSTHGGLTGVFGPFPYLSGNCFDSNYPDIPYTEIIDPDRPLYDGNAYFGIRVGLASVVEGNEWVGFQWVACLYYATGYRVSSHFVFNYYASAPIPLDFNICTAGAVQLTRTQEAPAGVGGNLTITPIPNA